MSNCNKSFYINQKGEELPYGRFDVCSLPCNGWLKTRLKDIYRFIKIGENSILDLDEKEFYPIEILPDDCLIYESRKQRNRFGVWSLSENRPVLAAQYKQIFSFVPNTPHHYVVRSAEDRLQIRRDGDVLVQDLGDIRGSLPSYLLKEGSPKLIKPRFQSGEKYYVCVDLYTGQENSPDFRCVGALMDGLRYMQDGSGAQYFVNENWEKVLDFPSGLEPEAEEYKPTYTPYLFISYITVRNINNGRIVVDAKNEGSYVMDYSGNIIIPPSQYRECHLLGENRIYLRNKKNHGAIADINGNKLTPFAFRNDWLLHGFRQQTICLAKWLGSRRVLYGCISPDLEELIPFENEYFIDGFVDNMGVLTVDIK